MELSLDAVHGHRSIKGQQDSVRRGNILPRRGGYVFNYSLNNSLRRAGEIGLVAPGRVTRLAIGICSLYGLSAPFRPPGGPGGMNHIV